MKAGNLFVPLLMTVLMLLAGCGERGAQKSGQVPQAGANVEAGSAAGQAEEAPTSETESAEGSVQLADTLWVMQARGSRQCEGGGLSVEQSRGKLVQGGITVIESRCGVRKDRMYPSVCGGATGDILLHRIKTELLDAALELGFDPAGKVPYEFSSCKDRGAGGPVDR
ncbi:hypothetical protein M0G74_00075 [Microbulbifer sp. CAU 1566]|uniref:hypothetical protein n=1 Tax=Microbulbifer sp. CAU 1566 TaxID=2933269 RepID=UPI00200337C0|nr:hypothetical protein [Microbulbifer sp. CAU 1566]MCK7595660.1 hypothetical protein [Microbulbifer sp. CAU 1566]